MSRVRVPLGFRWQLTIIRFVDAAGEPVPRTIVISVYRRRAHAPAPTPSVEPSHLRLVR